MTRANEITQFEQHAHLDEANATVQANPGLRATMGTDYLIRRT